MRRPIPQDPTGMLLHLHRRRRKKQPQALVSFSSNIVLNATGKTAREVLRAIPCLTSPISPTPLGKRSERTPSCWQVSSKAKETTCRPLLGKSRRIKRAIWFLTFELSPRPRESRRRRSRISPTRPILKTASAACRKKWTSCASNPASRPSPRAPSPPSFPLRKAEEPSAPKAAETSAVTELFQKHCVKCHGADGTGSQARDRLPEIPDFTSQTWQEKRSDAQLQAAILDGKGTFMPPFSNKLDNEKVKCLTELVRAYAAKSAENFSEQTTSPQTTAVVSFGSRGSAKSVRGIPTTIQRLIPSGVKLMIIVMIGRYRT